MGKIQQSFFTSPYAEVRAFRRQYGRYEGEPDEAQLTRYFHLDDTGRALTENGCGDHNRQGFALQLTTVRFLGTFLSHPKQVPRSALKFVTLQLANTGVDCLGNYMNRRATRLFHRAEIQSHYGYQDFNTLPWRFLPTLFNNIRFECAPAGSSTMAALD